MRTIGYDWYDVYIWWIYPSVVKHDWVWTPLQIDDTFWFQWENQLYIDRGFSSTPCSRTAQNSASLWDFTTFGIRNVLLHTIRSIHCASFQDVGEQSIIKFLFLTLVFMYWFPYFFLWNCTPPLSKHLKKTMDKPPNQPGHGRSQRAVSWERRGPGHVKRTSWFCRDVGKRSVGWLGKRT